MTTVWLVCEIIDLGYEVVKGYTSKARAFAECEQLRSASQAKHVRQLMSSPLGYTEIEAMVIAGRNMYYEVDAVDVDYYP
jgi:hypothetical protein